MGKHEEPFECVGCGKVRDDLPDHWSEVTVLDGTGQAVMHLHHCLECRSDKREAQ